MEVPHIVLTNPCGICTSPSRQVLVYCTCVHILPPPLIASPLYAVRPKGDAMHSMKAKNAAPGNRRCCFLLCIRNCPEKIIRHFIGTPDLMYICNYCRWYYLFRWKALPRVHLLLLNALSKIRKSKPEVYGLLGAVNRRLLSAKNVHWSQH